MSSRYHKGFGVVELAVIGIVVILITVLGWVAWDRIINSPGVKEDAEVAVTERKKDADSLAPEDVTNQMKTALEKKYKLLNIDESNQPKQGEMSIRLDKASPVYKVEGFNFYTSYDGGSSLYMMPHETDSNADLPTAESIALRKEVVGVYTNLGLKKTESRGDQNNEDVYMGKGLICRVKSLTAGTSANTMNCGSVAAYKGAAEKVKPLVDALPDSSSQLVVSTPKIENSIVSGYQRASVGTGMMDSAGGAIALFYKKGSGGWTYFRHTQNALSCEVFNTDDIKAAFKGETCYDSNDKESKV